jgi:hypothetical protein
MFGVWDCRALGRLPRLLSCTLYSLEVAGAISQLTPPSSACFLPLLPVHLLSIEGGDSLDVLSLLVMWTRLPSSRSAPLQCRVEALWSADPCVGGAVRFDVQPTSAANRGWLDVLLHNQLPINFFIGPDSSLRSLLPDLRRYSQPLGLTLQKRVHVEVLEEVLAAYSGQKLTVDVQLAMSVDAAPQVKSTGGHGAPQRYEASTVGFLKRRAGQQQQPPPPCAANLRCLDIGSCAAMSDSDMRVVVGMLGDGLTRLCLLDAYSLSDRTLRALLGRCRRLQRLELSEAHRVTEDGLAPLLVALQPSFSAGLTGTGVNLSELVRQVRGQGGCCRVVKGAAGSGIVNVVNSPQ